MGGGERLDGAHRGGGGACGVRWRSGAWSFGGSTGARRPPSRVTGRTCRRCQKRNQWRCSPSR
eukprot:6573627-Lingulodinium_polyedra.AAC.1